jgi:hypothetical protein
MQQIPNTHQWTNWEAVFSTQYVQRLHDVKILFLEAVFSIRSVPICYKQDKSKI